MIEFLMHGVMANMVMAERAVCVLHTGPFQWYLSQSSGRERQ